MAKDPKDLLLSSFQRQVGSLLLRHRSFLDVTSKLQESSARVNRALMKSVTECGCVEVHAKRQAYKDEYVLEEWKGQLDTHLEQQLCEHCVDVVRDEMGKNLFYLTALCNLLDLSVAEIVQKESEKLSTLGIFNLR
jgi:hypothetical protein